jgi:peptidoglycan/xylan/chitin deacetylase (PgdA/CDA1 family)
MAIRGLLRTLAGGRPAAAVVDLLETAVQRRPDSLAVLTFHRVLPAGSVVPAGLQSATPSGFAELLDLLAKRNDFISVDDLLRRADGGPALPRRSLLLTFDDAYVDFAEHAWPALRERGLAAVLFVPTAYPDSEARFWWDRVYRAVTTSSRPSVTTPGGELPLRSAKERVAAYRSIREDLKALPHDRLLEAVEKLVRQLGGDRPDELVLGWPRLRELAGEGVTLAPHTRTHPLLPRLDPASFDAEIAGSRDDLAKMTGSDTAAFAYPAGANSPQVAAAVRAAGFRVAFTTARGVNDLPAANWLLLRRINVSVGTPFAAVRAQLVR